MPLSSEVATNVLLVSFRSPGSRSCQRPLHPGGSPTSSRRDARHALGHRQVWTSHTRQNQQTKSRKLETLHGIFLRRAAVLDELARLERIDSSRLRTSHKRPGNHTVGRDRVSPERNFRGGLYWLGSFGVASNSPSAERTRYPVTPTTRVEHLLSIAQPAMNG